MLLANPPQRRYQAPEPRWGGPGAAQGMSDRSPLTAPPKGGVGRTGSPTGPERKRVGQRHKLTSKG